MYPFENSKCGAMCRCFSCEDENEDIQDYEVSLGADFVQISIKIGCNGCKTL
jgi:hypothetical protein